MKEWITIIAIVLMVIFAAGCTSSEPKTYNGNGISFQYPGDWSTNYKNDVQKTFGSLANVSVSLGKDDAGMAVAKRDMGSDNNSFDSITSGFKSGLQSGGYSVTSEKTRTIDGNNATEFVTKVSKDTYGSYTIFEKNNNLYLIMIATPDNDQKTIDMILNSFKVQ